MKIFAIALSVLLLLPISAHAQKNNFPTVVSVGDGNTVRVLKDGETITVRLGCIDAPEIAQKPYGERSRDRLSQLLPKGQAIQLREIERDRYGRTVGEIFRGRRSINQLMVAQGYAVIYTPYLKNCQNSRDEYIRAEATAKGRKLNFWSQSNPQKPWDFRKERRR